MDGEIQVRHNAYRTFAPGTLFNISSWLWELLSCVPEPDGRGNVLTLRKLSAQEMAVADVMLS